jgi:4-hydroxy-tetrahydrodipicolinate synthase
MTQIITSVPQHFKVYSGDDSLTLPVLAIGGYGIVSVASHIIGAEMKQMITYFLQGEIVKATQMHARLFPVFKGIFRMPSPAPIKHALIIKGFNVGGVRLPLIEVTESEETFLKSLINSLKTTNS